VLLICRKEDVVQIYQIDKVYYFTLIMKEIDGNEKKDGTREIDSLPALSHGYRLIENKKYTKETPTDYEHFLNFNLADHGG